jgi:GAF domain-containing protein
MVALSSQLRSLLVAEAERARVAVAADCAAISCWDRPADTLRTLVNVGHLRKGDERFPVDELYPLDSFPAVARLLRDGRPYLDPEDVASAAIAAHQRYGSHAAVPIVVSGDRWGELWVARRPGAAPLTGGDIDRLHLVADRLGDALAAHL